MHDHLRIIGDSAVEADETGVVHHIQRTAAHGEVERHVRYATFGEKSAHPHRAAQLVQGHIGPIAVAQSIPGTLVGASRDIHRSVISRKVPAVCDDHRAPVAVDVGPRRGHNRVRLRGKAHRGARLDIVVTLEIVDLLGQEVQPTAGVQLPLHITGIPPRLIHVAHRRRNDECGAVVKAMLRSIGLIGRLNRKRTIGETQIRRHTRRGIILIIGAYRPFAPAQIGPQLLLGIADRIRGARHLRGHGAAQGALTPILGRTPISPFTLCRRRRPVIGVGRAHQAQRTSRKTNRLLHDYLLFPNFKRL